MVIIFGYFGSLGFITLGMLIFLLIIQIIFSKISVLPVRRRNYYADRRVNLCNEIIEGQSNK